MKDWFDKLETTHSSAHADWTFEPQLCWRRL
jgi:hypothetical protein